MRAYMRVKMPNTPCEQMFSAPPPNSDIARRSRHFAFVPQTEVDHHVLGPPALPMHGFVGSQDRVAHSLARTGSRCRGGLKRFVNAQNSNRHHVLRLHVAEALGGRGACYEAGCRVAFSNHNCAARRPRNPDLAFPSLCAVAFSPSTRSAMSLAVLNSRRMPRGIWRKPNRPGIRLP